jgi:putative ABC transport system ATP-binding protein
LEVAAQVIELDSVSKVYTVGGEKIHALDRVSLTIYDGDYISIVGPSGSGKSTLMNILGCLDSADEGVYSLDGLAIEGYTENELAKIRSQKIGFVFQSFNLLPRMSIAENVELPLIYQGVPARERREMVASALGKAGLSNRASHRPNAVSGGQQQRAAIARAIVGSPSLILADEPTGNLDSQTGGEIMELFESLNREGKTLVLITHDSAVASRAQRILRIRDGRLEGA